MKHSKYYKSLYRCPSLKLRFLVIVMFGFSTIPLMAGEIDTNDKWAWSENAGWFNWQTSDGDVAVLNEYLSGYVWAENIGWIKLGVDAGGPYESTSSTNWGVNHNSSTGELSGLAWSENAGWINFAPTLGGVTINTSTGDFSGYAWSENVGWIHLAANPLDAIQYKVNTSLDDPLPATLSTFTSQIMDGIATLNWTTQTEFNNLGWNVYRSVTPQIIDAFQINFSIIPGAGTTSVPSEYIFEDEHELIADATYWYWLESVSGSGETVEYDPISLTTPADLEDPETPDIPAEFGLYQNYPNPFNPDTQISFALIEAGECKLKIYNIEGQLVRDLFSGLVEENRIYSFNWNGCDDSGKEVDSGMYFYQIKVGKFTSTKKMLLLK